MCIKIICVTIVYNINFEPMHDINMTLGNLFLNQLKRIAMVSYIMDNVMIKAY